MGGMQFTLRPSSLKDLRNAISASPNKLAGVGEVIESPHYLDTTIQWKVLYQVRRGSPMTTRWFQLTLPRCEAYNYFENHRDAQSAMVFAKMPKKLAKYSDDADGGYATVRVND